MTDQRLANSQLQQEVRRLNAAGLGVSSTKLEQLARNQNITQLQEIEIAAYKQYVTIDRFLMGIVSGGFIGAGTLAIILIATNTITFPASIAGADSAILGMLFLGMTFGVIFSMRFNRRARKCPGSHEAPRKNAQGVLGPVEQAARFEQTCMNDFQCTNLGNSISQNDYVRNVQGRCNPVKPWRPFYYIQIFVALAALILGITFCALGATNIGKSTTVGQILVSTSIGLFVGWLVGFVFS